MDHVYWCLSPTKTTISTTRNVRDVLDKAFELPATLDEFHIGILQALEMTAASNLKNPYRQLIDAIEEHGSIIVGWE